MFSRLDRGSTSAQRVAELDAETLRKQGTKFGSFHSRGERKTTQTAGFDGVLSSLSFAAERKGAAGGITAGAVRGERIATGAARPRNDTLQGVRCAAAHMGAALQNNFCRAGPGQLAGVRLGSGSGCLPIEFRRAACPHTAVGEVQHPASGWGQLALRRTMRFLPPGRCRHRPLHTV